MIKYGINTFTWVSPFRTQDLPLLDKAKALGFDLFEIPIEGVEDIDYAQAAEAYRRTGLNAACAPSWVPAATRHMKMQPFNAAASNT
jgi:sugar phosphate isomerase/epimerase